MSGVQALGMMGQMATALNRGSPTNHMLFTQPPTSGLQAPANPSTVFLLTSSAPESVTFSQTVQSPTFLTQMPAQVTYGLLSAPLSAASALGCVPCSICRIPALPYGSSILLKRARYADKHVTAMLRCTRRIVACLAYLYQSIATSGTCVSGGALA